MLLVRRAFFGYKPSDVDVVLARYQEQLTGLAASVDRLWVEREALTTELGETKAELERVRASERDRAEQLESEARALAARIVAEAEEQALQTRQWIGARVADATSRLDELLRTRERLLDDLRTLLANYEHALERLDAPAARAGGSIAEDEQTAVRPLRRPAPESLAETLFPRRVEIDAGPFDDFTELSSFERSLAELPRIEDVYIRSFEQSRAIIELALAEERPLVSDLYAHVPFELHVDDTVDGRLRIEIEPAAAASG